LTITTNVSLIHILTHPFKSPYKMAELPWFKFIIAHWMLDRNLAKCSSATRGVWLELIIAMHQDDRSGELRETVDHLALLARTTTVVMTQALTELQTTGTADVTFRNEMVTVVNRKMKREYKERISTNLRVKKHRSNKNVTPPETPQSKEERVNSKEEERDAPPAPRSPSWKKLTEKEFYQDIGRFTSEFPKDMLRKFYDYWREPSATGKMRFQLERTWDTHRRLRTWQERDKTFLAKKDPENQFSAPPLKQL